MKITRGGGETLNNTPRHLPQETNNHRAKIPAGTNIAFRDDFDGGPYPNSFWQLCWSNRVDRPMNAWTRYLNIADYECVRVEDSCLKLTAKKGDGTNFKTGGVWSLNNRYGIGTSLKVRAKLYRKGQEGKQFNVPSAFPAIWYNELYSDWPKKGEIDLMEWVNISLDKPFSTIHYKTDGKNQKGEFTNGSIHSNNTVVDVSEWHVYSCDLYEDNVVIYYDDKEVFRYTNNGSNPYPFNTNHYVIILNASLQKSWGTAVEKDSSELPYEMWVDWVEVSLIDKITGQPIK